MRRVRDQRSAGVRGPVLPIPYNAAVCAGEVGRVPVVHARRAKGKWQCWQRLEQVLDTHLVTLTISKTQFSRVEKANR